MCSVSFRVSLTKPERWGGFNVKRSKFYYPNDFTCQAVKVICAVNTQQELERNEDLHKPLDLHYSALFCTFILISFIPELCVERFNVSFLDSQNSDGGKSRPRMP